MKRLIFFISLPLIIYSDRYHGGDFEDKILNSGLCLVLDDELNKIGNRNIEEAVPPLFIEENQVGYKPGNTLIQALLPLAAYTGNIFPKSAWTDPNICKNLSFQSKPSIFFPTILPKRKPPSIIANPVLLNSNEVAMVMGSAPLSALLQVFRRTEDSEVGEAPSGKIASDSVEKSFDSLPKPEEPSSKSLKSSYPLPKRIYMSHIEGWNAGINYGTDYSTLGILFSPDYTVGHFLPMFDLRGHRFDNNTYATNVGFVGRYIPSTFCELLGANIYYDYRQGSIGHFHQIGAGLEILGKRWDFRANIYVPISVSKHVLRCTFDQYAGGYYIIDKKTESISYGYNAEVGYLFVRSDKFMLYGALGPYYMTGRRCHEKTRGWKARIRPEYKDYIALDLSATHDPVYNTVYQAEIIISIPLYVISAQNKGRCGVTDRQIYQRVERFEVMPIGKCRCVQRNF